jgi:hypothetical protein
VINVVLVTGPERGAVTRVPLVVRDSTIDERSGIIVQVPVNTWQAYNAWGGKSLYAYNSSDRKPAVAVSFARPLDGDGLQRAIFQWEFPFVEFLERNGYSVSYVTDIDVDRNPSLLKQARLVVVLGHDEYWSKSIRDGLEAARDAGVNLLFMGANIGYWQARYSRDHRTLIEYRGPRADPAGTSPTATGLFRQLTPPRPECRLLGVQSQGGHLGAGDKAHDYRATGDVPQGWLEGVGTFAGHVIPGVVGDEWDQSVPACKAVHVVLQSSGPKPAEAAWYQGPSGAIVFSAGTLELSSALVGYNGISHDIRLDRFFRNLVDDLTVCDSGGTFSSGC